MQSALRSTPSFQRWILRALPAIAAALALVPLAAGQPRTSMPVPTVTTLTSEIGASHGGTPGVTTLTVHVSPAPQEPNAETGAATVDFLDTDADGRVHSLGSSLVAADGTASLALSSLPAGANAVRAVYSGSNTLAASVSAVADVTAQATAVPDFTITAAPSTLNLNAGVQGTVAVTLTPSAGFSNYVSLSCAGLPLYSTCTFLPSNVSVVGAVGKSTMTLNTVAPSGTRSSLASSTGLVYAFLLPGALGLAGLGFGRNRSLRALAVLCLAGSLIAGASSCAQRYTYLNHGPTANLGTPNGQSIIRIYGTAVTGAESTVRCFQIILNVASTNTSGSSGNITTPCS